MDKKVAIITYYGDNYGGCLQAYAIQENVRQFGYIPELLKNEHTLPIKKAKNVFRRIFRVLSNPIAFIRRRKYVNDLSNGDVIRKQKFNIFRVKYLNFSSCKPVTLQNWETYGGKGYRTFICGSDQIWNPNLYPVDPIYFMRFVGNGVKKIAYAPSVGVSTIDHKYDSQIKDALSDYYYISVREDDGAKAISNIIGQRVESVLDPTLLLNEGDWSKITSENKYGEYILCYLFGESPFFDECKKFIKEKTGLKLISLPYNLREMMGNDQLLFDAGPEDFVSLIKHAKLVLTDSFHATAFAINLSTPFLTLERHKAGDKKCMNSRIYTLLKKVCLEDRLLFNTQQLENILVDQILNMDFTNPIQLLDKLRTQDRNKFAKALSNE